MSPFVPLLVLQERWRHPASTVRSLSLTAAMLAFVTDGDDIELLHRQVRWPHLYDGYRRLASPPDALFDLIESAQLSVLEVACTDVRSRLLQSPIGHRTGTRVIAGALVCTDRPNGA